MLNFEQQQALAEIYSIIKDKKYSTEKIQTQLLKKYEKNILSQLSGQDYLIKTSKSVVLTRKGLAAGYSNWRILAVLRVFTQEILGISKKESDLFIENIIDTIDEYLLEKFCTLVGHNFNHSIPPGECCRRAAEETSEQVIPLTKLPLNTEATVLYIKNESDNSVQKLFSLGVYPGRHIRLHQLYPIYIINLGSEQIALGREVAQHVFVKK